MSTDAAWRFSEKKPTSRGWRTWAAGEAERGPLMVENGKRTKTLTSSQHHHLLCHKKEMLAHTLQTNRWLLATLGLRVVSSWPVHWSRAQSRPNREPAHLPGTFRHEAAAVIARVAKLWRVTSYTWDDPGKYAESTCLCPVHSRAEAIMAGPTH